MSGETPAYARYKEYCGSEHSGVASSEEAIDWTQQETTPDQARIGAVLDGAHGSADPPRRGGQFQVGPYGDSGQVART